MSEKGCLLAQGNNIYCLKGLVLGEILGLDVIGGELFLDIFLRIKVVLMYETICSESIYSF